MEEFVILKFADGKEEAISLPHAMTRRNNMLTVFSSYYMAGEIKGYIICKKIGGRVTPSHNFGIKCEELNKSWFG